MRYKNTITLRGSEAALLVALVCVLAMSVAAASAPQQPGTAPHSVPTAVEKFKNIQVLKEIPADELIPSMEFIAGSLGVGCDFCHVEHEFDKDDKTEKKTARAMMQMMFAINQDNFKGEREVTCNTCHRGSPHPQAIPAVLAEAPRPAAAEAHQRQADPASLPSGAPLLAKYIQALGGRAALEKVSTRVETGQALVAEGGPLSITIYSKAPDQRVSVMRMPKGDSTTAYNGQTGWLSFPGRPPRAMSPADQFAARLDAEAFYPLALEQQFEELKLQEHAEKLGDREANVVLGIVKGQAPVKLYFDSVSGLLVRMVHYTQTPLGLLPTQVDFADYRLLDGVRSPYRWTIGRPSGSFTIQIDKVEQNVAIDEVRFAEPQFAPPPVLPATSPH